MLAPILNYPDIFTILSSSPFSFTGAFFSTVDNPPPDFSNYVEATILNIFGLNNIGERIVITGWAGINTFVNANFEDIYGIEIEMDGVIYMDDFTFEKEIIPEPSTMILFLTGLLGAGFFKKRLKR